MVESIAYKVASKLMPISSSPYNRQARNGDNLRVRGFGSSHPGRHRQRRAIGAPHDIVDLVVKVVQPDHWKVLCTQRMVAVVDRDFSRVLLMGSMSFSCSNGSSSMCGSKLSSAPPRTP